MACGNDVLNVTGTEINNPIHLPGNDCGVNSVISTSVTILLIVAIVISFLMLVFGGLQYIMSGGDPKGVGNAKGRIMYSVIGLAVSMLALVIFKLLGNFFGFNL